ncbi:MAG: phosphomevalonate kinase [Alyxoria varia]|nr:MAG: phosphomevalonate kinase [Alyxoria varia]
MTTATTKRTAVSSPGKVLLTGGYLVLDRKYTGLVFALDARIHVLVRDVEGGDGGGGRGVGDGANGGGNVEEDGRGNLDGAGNDTTTRIEVKSPQFQGAVWRYRVKGLGNGRGVEVDEVREGNERRGSAPTKPSTAPRNPFVQTALTYALNYTTIVLSSHSQPPSKLKPTSITILADNAYYSAPHPSSTSDTTSHHSNADAKPADDPTPSQPPYQHAQKPQPKYAQTRTEKDPQRFTNFNIPLSRAHKTGLGSSAALVTSLIAGILSHHLPTATFTLPQTNEPSPSTSTPSHPSARKDPSTLKRSKEILHNLAQTAHSAAQGKIGSGFDIASAVYGSCTYRRFSPSVLSNIPEPGEMNFATALREVVEAPASGGEPMESAGQLLEDDDAEADKDEAEGGSNEPGALWDQSIQTSAAKMPKGLRLVMCDVDAGSATPGMVRKVLIWRERNRAYADDLWDALQAVNDAFAEELAVGLDDDDEGGEELHRHPLRENFSQMQTLLTHMSAAADVPVLPPSQANLLEALTTDERMKDTVVGGVVPGAGGFDAVALVVKDTDSGAEGGESATSRLERYLDAEWNGVGAGAGAAEEGQRMVVRPLDVREDERGGCLREGAESVMYGGWI